MNTANSKPETISKPGTASLWDTVRQNWEFLLLLVPPVPSIVDRIQRTQHRDIILNGNMSALLFYTPILLCLFFITLKYRNNKFRGILLRYGFVGLVCFAAVFASYVLALFCGWIPDDGGFGWYILMSPIVIALSSIITMAAGSVFWLIMKLILLSRKLRQRP